MKRNISIIIGIVVILVVIIALQKKSAPEAAVNTDGQTPVQVVTSTSTPTPVTTVPKKTTISPAVPAKTVTTPAPAKATSATYADYMATITAARNKCTATAKVQYTNMYSGLESASFLSYYNEKTGGCYSKIVGDTRAQYATTTNAIIGHSQFES